MWYKKSIQLPPPSFTLSLLCEMTSHSPIIVDDDTLELHSGSLSQDDGLSLCSVLPGSRASGRSLQEDLPRSMVPSSLGGTAADPPGISGCQCSDHLLGIGCVNITGGGLTSSQPIRNADTWNSLSRSPLREATNALPPPKGTIRGKNFFLTAPQCNVHADVALENLRNILGNSVKEALFVRETHKDGSYHLHGAFSLEKREYLSNTLTNKIFGKHGNFQVTVDNDTFDHAYEVLDHRDLSDYALYMFNGDHCTLLFILQEMADVSVEGSE